MATQDKPDVSNIPAFASPRRLWNYRQGSFIGLSLSRNSLFWCTQLHVLFGYLSRWKSGANDDPDFRCWKQSPEVHDQSQSGSRFRFNCRKVERSCHFFQWKNTKRLFFQWCGSSFPVSGLRYLFLYSRKRRKTPTRWSECWYTDLPECLSETR